MAADPVFPPPTDDPTGSVLLAERALIGAMLTSLEDCRKAATLLEPASFYRVPHRKTFEALLRLTERGEAPSLAGVLAELEASRELELVGGAALVASFAEYAGQSANLEAHARIVREGHQKRRIRHMGVKLQEMAQDPQKESGEILAQLSEATGTLLDQRARVDGRGRFAEAAIDGASFARLEIVAPRSLIGDGVLVSGGFGILYGKPGLGKSWLFLSMMRSFARGEPWLGIPTDSAGVRVGLIQLELSAYRMQARMNTLGIGQHGRDAEIRVVCRPNLKGVIDLYRKTGDLAALRQWIVQDGLNVLALDALSRAHTADENKSEEMGVVLSELDSIRHETGCAIMLVHHETKSQEDPNNHLDVLRGSGRLQSDPTLHIRVHRAKGLRCVRFARVTEGAEPEPVYYQIDPESGNPVIMKSPDAVKEDNRERVFHEIGSATHPVSRADLVSSVGMSPATVKRHLQGLLDEGRISASGSNRDTRYFIATGSPAQPAHDQGRAGLSDTYNERLNESWR